MNCLICNGNVTEFLDLGRQPSCNAFLSREEFDSESFFNLKLGMCDTCLMVQLIEQMPPSKLWGDIIKNVSFDLVCDERVFYFTVSAIAKVLEKANLKLLGVTPTFAQGGSMRYYVGKRERKVCMPNVMFPDSIFANEMNSQLFEHHSFRLFADAVRNRRQQLKSMLDGLADKKIVGYGATSKSTALLNYCGLGPETLAYITDTTPAKQGKFSPGMHIPIVSPDIFHADYPDYALLLAWNHGPEIKANEQEFANSGGKFIHYVPMVFVS